MISFFSIRRVTCRNFCVAAAIIFACIVSAIGEETQWRKWTSAAGTEMAAKLITFAADEVTLEKRDGKQVKVAVAQLSAADREFLAQQKPAPGNAIVEKADKARGATTIPGVDAVPGTVSKEIFCAADAKWSYLLYLPKAFHAGRRWPVCFVMDSQGGDAKRIARYLPAADHLEMIVAVTKESKNDFADSDVAMMAMLKDVYARLPVLENMAISSGVSGGSRMAYRMAEMDKNIAGVLACASGDGLYNKDKTGRQAQLRPNMIICSLMGSNCFNRREAVKSHQRFDRSSRLIWFEGNHDWAGPDLIQEGLTEVFAGIIRKKKEREIVQLGADLAERQLAHITKLKETHSWVSYRWAKPVQMLAGSGRIKAEAAALESRLAKDPIVMKGLKAEKEIQEFAEKYFGSTDADADQAPDTGREREAGKKAEEFKDLPHGALFKKLGEPAVKP
jgi:hypothetical protein